VRPVKLPILLSFFLAFSTAVLAQEVVEHPKPVQLRHIHGVVVNAAGNSIPYALIELRDAGDHHVLATNFADGNGKFSLPDRKRGEQLEIRASIAGFKAAQYAISMAIVGKERLRVVLLAAK
jgi:hypothetical protein